MNSFEALSAGKCFANDYPGSHVAPCSDCGSPLFWRYTSVGPMFCVNCVSHDPKRVKCRKVIVEIAGKPTLIDEAVERAARERFQETGVLDFTPPKPEAPAARRDPRTLGRLWGTKINVRPEDEWRATTEEEFEAYFESRSKACGPAPAARAPRIPDGAKVWIADEAGHVYQAGDKRLKEPRIFTWEGGDGWFPASMLPAHLRQTGKPRAAA